MSKKIAPSRAPVRIRFKLNAQLPSTGTISLGLPSELTYSGEMKCVIREILANNNFIDKEAKDVTATNQNIVITPNFAIDANKMLELILTVINDDVNNLNFPAPTSGSPQITGTFTAGIVMATSKLTITPFKLNPSLVINSIRLLQLANGGENSIMFEVTSQENIAAYPDTFIEIELSSSASVTGMSKSHPCGVSKLGTRDLSLMVRCTLIDSMPPRIRIEGLDEIQSGTTFSIFLFDFDHIKFSSDFVKYFSAKLFVIGASNTKSQIRMKRLFTPEGTITTLISTSAFPGISPGYYGSRNTLTKTIVWEDPCIISQCRILVRGAGINYKFNDEMRLFIDTIEQTIVVDKVNNAFCKIFLF